MSGVRALRSLLFAGSRDCVAELGKLAREALERQAKAQAEEDRFRRRRQNGGLDPEPEIEVPEEKKDSLRSARERISSKVNSDASDDLFDSILNEAMGATRSVRHEFSCKHCGGNQIQIVKVADIKTQIAAAEFLMNQGEGRPGEAKPQTQALVVNRRVIYTSDEDDDE